MGHGGESAPHSVGVRLARGCASGGFAGVPRRGSHWLRAPRPETHARPGRLYKKPAPARSLEEMARGIQATPWTEEAAAKHKAKYVLINPTNILKLYEAKFKARYCTGCRAMVPTENFQHHPEKFTIRHFVCKLHRRVSPGRPVKYDTAEAQLRHKAALSIRARAREDRLVFGHALIDLSLEETQALLTQPQVDKYLDYALVPARPTELLSTTNAVVVSFAQRKYLIGLWKASKDPEEYERDMAILLQEGARQTDPSI